MITGFSRYTVCMLFCTGVLYGCKNHKLPLPAVYNSQPNTEESLRIPLDSLDPVYKGLARARVLTDFYRHQHAQPGWHKQGQRMPVADSLIGTLQRAAYYGLPGSGYHCAEIAALAPDRSAASRQRMDMLLTDAYLSLAHDLKFGLLTPYADEMDSIALASLMHVASGGGVVASLESQEPCYPAYHALKTGLRVLLDSIVVQGADTSLLNTRIRAIDVNLERWRQERAPWQERRLVVNIPAYRLDIIDKGDTLLSSRVIVGNPQHPTPELSSVIRSFTLYPYWVVPRKIAVEEYLPVIKTDTTFFLRTDFEVLDRQGNLLDPRQVPWKNFHKNNFPVVLRQREGTGNALGLIKFTFNNPYGVFLHDTNAKQLFKKNARAFSHGCMRVENATAIARYLMTGSVDRESAVVSRYLDEQRQAVITAPVPLPIYVRYFTVEVIEGALVFNADIYGSDKVLSRQLIQVELARPL